MAGLITPILCASILVLSGIDWKISSLRWKKGYKDLNPVVQFGVKNYGPLGGGLAILSLTTLSLVTMSLLGPVFLGILFGAKLSLATIQSRSLYEQYSNQSKQSRS